ncbi:hypothetical protein Taro_004349 [Colocasia esculenta]|uniref:Uncharacterized protein n=1 Tax=Colocasia esculenta TaxID=4460 RepID=A0A843TRD6_COLES|nr:hypothetical protein [Colocasia esculenta]
MGHMARDCPLLPRVPQQQAPVQQRQQTGGFGGSRGRGRVTHLTRAVAEAAHLVEDSLGELSSGESVELAVELPTRDFVLTSYCLEEVPVQLQDQLLSARLFALQLHDYDVILGMDWLGRYGAVMDCQKKRVHLRIPGAATFYFQAPAVVRQVAEAQQADPELHSVLLLPEVELCEDGTVRFRDRLYVPVEESIRRVGTEDINVHIC